MLRCSISSSSSCSPLTCTHPCLQLLILALAELHVNPTGSTLPRKGMDVWKEVAPQCSRLLEVVLGAEPTADSRFIKRVMLARC
jgi:hypothetical protein